MRFPLFCYGIEKVLNRTSKKQCIIQKYGIRHVFSQLLMKLSVERDWKVATDFDRVLNILFVYLNGKIISPLKPVRTFSPNLSPLHLPSTIATSPTTDCLNRFISVRVDYNILLICTIFINLKVHTKLILLLFIHTHCLFT